MYTNPTLLMPNIVQPLYEYVQSWGSLPITYVNWNPVKSDPPNMNLDGMESPYESIQTRTDIYLERSHEHQSNLLRALGVDVEAYHEEQVKSQNVRDWFVARQDSLSWSTADLSEGRLILEDLIQLHHALHQTQTRVEKWRGTGFGRRPPGTEQHFEWLRDFMKSRVTLSVEALNYSETEMALRIFYDSDKRRLFQVIGIEESVQRYFNVNLRALRKKSPPPTRSTE